MIITDGSKGFISAIELVYPHAKHQRCWVHKLRNATKYLKKADIKAFKAAVRIIKLRENVDNGELDNILGVLDNN